MKPILVILFALCLMNAKAQFVEKIYLKDSITTYTGWVVEQVPQDYLKILRQKERDTIQVPANKIWKIVRVLDLKASNPFSITQRVAGIGGRSQALYLEFVGNSYDYSLNYDTRLKKGIRDGWGIRAGAGFSKFHSFDAILNQKTDELTFILPT